MLNEKWLRTMQVFDSYEKRFAEAELNRQFAVPTTKDAKAKIIDQVKCMLKFDEALIPSIANIQEVRRDRCDTYDAVQLTFTTWENFHSSATLFVPHITEGQKAPLCFVFCGHGKDGRLTEGYVLMAERLAGMGVATVVHDNIGQGDRKPLGHWDAIAPFYCGLTMQGLILMESVALIRHFVKQPWVDIGKVGACGNSGGGTLCLFLAALAPELTALCPTGYPSDFSYLLSKERSHCACNLLPGCALGPQMWEILSCFAPKSLMIEQGINDHLIPYDRFMRTARKVGYVYRQMGVENNFKAEYTSTTHPWAPDDCSVITKFFADNFGITDYEDADNEEIMVLSASWHIEPPEDGLTTDQLAEKLTGKKMPEGTRLCDIFKPQFNGEPINADDIIPDVGRGDVMKIFAQMECALTKL